MGATLRSIADRAGVSLPTVSQILSPTGKRADLFSAATRRRIHAIAAEMGYRPNAAARTVATGRFNCVALVLSTFHNRSILPEDLVAGIDAALAPRDLHLALARLPDEKLTDPAFVPKLLRQWTSDGLLINYNAHIPARMVELIRDCGLPAVWINSQHSHDCVYPDDRQGGFDLTTTLLQHGHRRVAFVDYTYGTVPGSRHYSNPDRRAGYERAMTAAGLSPAFLQAHGNIPLDQRLDFTAHWLRQPDRPTAVVCYTHHEAAAVLASADRLGLSLPRDLTVATFNPTPVSHFGYDLPTALLPEHAIGRHAAELLLRKINDPAVSAAPLPVRLDIRIGQAASPLSR